MQTQGDRGDRSRHHCGSIRRDPQEDRDVGARDRSKKVPGGRKNNDGPYDAVSPVGLSWDTESPPESLRTSGSGDCGEARSLVYLHTPGALIQSTVQMVSKPGPKFL